MRLPLIGVHRANLWGARQSPIWGAQTLDDTACGAASDVVPKFVSPSDPAAQWTGAHKWPAFFAYSDNYLIDVKFGVIVDVEASRAIRQAEVGAARTMIERTEERFGLKPERLVQKTAATVTPSRGVESSGVRWN